MKLDSMNTWVTSDLHLGHDREFIWGPRGFNSVEEHDAEIIRLWNETVPPDGEVYILGDLMLGDNDAGLEKLKQLNGRLHIAIGNHDTDARIGCYSELDNVVEMGMGFRNQCRKLTLIMTHYPTIVSNYGENGTINLCGHSHTKNRWEHAAFGCYHCELDAHDNKPILLNDLIDEVKEYSE